MRIALCVSGVARGSAEKNIEALRKQFPTADLYTATWRGYEDNYPVDFVFDEPEITYNCVLDVINYPDASSIRREKAAGRDSYISVEHDGERWHKIIPHWTKQILIHDYLLTKIPKYDIIIRSRFDVIISDKIDWEQWVKKSWDEQVAIGFNTRVFQYHDKMHEIRDLYPAEAFLIHDALLIHPMDIWDSDYVQELHNTKQLKGAESGWFQVLSEHPYNYFHYSYHGGVLIEKYIGRVQDYDE